MIPHQEDALCLKVMVANHYIRRHGMTPSQFLRFAEENELLHFGQRLRGLVSNGSGWHHDGDGTILR